MQRPAVVADDPIRPPDKRRQRSETRVAGEVKKLTLGQILAVGNQVVARPDDLSAAAVPQQQVGQLPESVPPPFGPPAIGKDEDWFLPAATVGEAQTEIGRLAKTQFSAQFRFRPQHRAEPQQSVKRMALLSVRGQRDLLPVEKRGSFACIAAPDFDPGPGPPDHQAGAQQTLHVERIIKLRLPHLAHELKESAQPLAPAENIDPVHHFTVADQRLKNVPHDPGDPEIGPLRLERSRDLQAVHDVPECGGLDDEQLWHGALTGTAHRGRRSKELAGPRQTQTRIVRPPRVSCFCRLSSATLSMQSDHVLPREAVAPNGGARRPWRALNFAVEEPAGTAGSTLVNCIVG